MTAPASIFAPYARLVRITVLGQECEVPENNTLLRGLQYLAPEPVAMGRFCWNEECQYCRVAFDCGEGTPSRIGLACKLQTQEGLQVTEITPEIRYCLRSKELK